MLDYPIRSYKVKGVTVYEYATEYGPQTELTPTVKNKQWKGLPLSFYQAKKNKAKKSR